MYVKSLTLKGFKSFASATSMKLEPGITCIVGPNGSGKSNVVDALAWVMGEQGAKSLRGGKMEDVIFAGTAKRPALGRAEVSLTIDNSDGALPIDYTEVTITRTMFKGGGSEYQINGTNCRLLDIQELLSDSGIGREMHVIVGQGQLDTVLRATPEERRGFIEEAAGVLKHRKRKERALRKLEQMEGNLHRVSDLTAEIRRQLGPLGRQAETARKAAMIQADVRDSRLRLLADDLVQLTSTLEQEVADETALLERQAQVKERLASAQRVLADLEQEAQEAAPEQQRVSEQWFAFSSLKERVEATAGLAAERVRLLTEDEAHEKSTSSGRDPERLKAQAAKARDDLAEMEQQIERAEASLQEAIERREGLEKAHQEEQQRLTRLARAAADRREGLAKLEGQVGARRSRIEAGEAELGRMERGAEEIVARVAKLEKEHTELETTIAQDEEGEEGLDAAYEDAEGKVEAARAALKKAQDDLAAAEKDRTTAQARVDALEMSLTRKDGAAHLMEHSADGLRGALTSLLTVEAGAEAAIAAALGWAADAVVVDDLDAGARALQTLRDDDAGRATLVVAGGAKPGTSGTKLPAGARWATDVVSGDADLRDSVAAMLTGVVLVDDADTAKKLVGEHAELVAVTSDGDVFAAGYVRGGSTAAPSLLEIQAAVDESKAVVADATSRGEKATFAVEKAKNALTEHESELDAALDRLNASDARMASVVEQLSQLGQGLRNAKAEQERLVTSRGSVEENLQQTRAELAELEERLASAQAEPEAEEPTTDERDRLATEAAAARSHETDVRLTLRTKQEQARSLSGRADSLEAAARNELEAREKARIRRERRMVEKTTAQAVQVAAAELGQHVVAALAVAQQRREAAERARRERDEELGRQRKNVTTIGDELRELTDTVHKDEVARAQQRLRIEAMQQKAVEEHGISPEALVEEFGPHQLIPPVPGPDDDPDDLPEPVPFVRAQQEKRLRAAERKLNQLGRVNPLALEEFAAMEERHKFLVEQLEDLKESKRDLLDIVDEVDRRVEEAFANAFYDTAAEFEGVFSRLFPGGEGRLVLTDPDNMLTTGLEVEARPPGKKIKRLSLLSGGERSLVAVALLVSIFKARPSPFYIMDEVEAALDDANLGRLITLFEELRDSSQLIVITHQKRTMEVADALYGVSMRGDGVTTVVSQRMRDIVDGDATGAAEASDGSGGEPEPVDA